MKILNHLPKKRMANARVKTRSAVVVLDTRTMIRLLPMMAGKAMGCSPVRMNSVSMKTRSTVVRVAGGL